MRVETNVALVKRMKQIAQWLFFGSFGGLIVWLLISSQAMSPQNSNLFLTVVVPSVLLPASFASSMLSVRFTNLWVRQPRPEEAIRQNLKGLSNRSVLYNYFHMPARHVLITPRGVYAMITRFQDGQFSVKGNVWKSHKNAISRFFSIFRFDGIGNPTEEAYRAAAHVQKLLAPIAGNVTVQPVIVFVDPRAVVNVEDSPVPIVFADSKSNLTLKDYLHDASRPMGKKEPDVLSLEQIQAFEAASIKQ